ncbi:MAG: hypothetical protein HY735_16815 [Verrucomicrobia bacterium]|nr:hypothetical protein [Verrucomicrobiota bacterium]
MIAWPAWAQEFSLQASTTGSMPPSSWTNVGAAFQTVGDDIIVTLPVAPDSKFFRLNYP